MIERIRSELEQLAIENNGDAKLHITASFGMALLDPDLPVVDSIDRADNATYAAKWAGRNRVMLWEPSMTEAEKSAAAE